VILDASLPSPNHEYIGVLKMSGTTRRYDVFFSYNSSDHVAVETVACALRERGLNVFLDRWYLVPGRPWPQVLEEVLSTCQAVCVFLGRQGMGSWQQREKELALARQIRDSTFPVIPVLLPGAEPALGFLSLNTWVDMRVGADDPGAVAVMAAAVGGQPPSPELREQIHATLSTVCPYRGLRHFREEDASLFFGREASTARLAEAVGQHSLVALVGASGCGKSSVARAGLVPCVRKGIGEQVWDVTTLVPGGRPLHALAAAFMPLLEPELDEVDRLEKIGRLAGHVADKSVVLQDVVARALEKQAGTDRLLLVVDQWEELYALADNDRSRQRFVEELLEATVGRLLTVVVTLRGDFYGRLLEDRALADRLQDAVVNLGPMKREELRQAIESPARQVGLTFEPGLVHRILDDVGEEPGNLPLLEFVLTSLWEQRQRGMLLHDAYEAMGEVQGAMAHRADQVFGKLPSDQQKVVHRVLVQLVRPGEGTEPTRRRATFAEVGEAARLVVQQLADARLTVTGRDEATGEQTVEVAHEALIRNWGRLRGWLDEDKEFLLWWQRLRAHLDEWERTQREKAALLHGALLTEAEHWRGERAYDLGPSEQDFIEQSMARREEERAAVEAAEREKEASRQRELANATALAQEQQRRARVAEALAKEQEERTQVAAALAEEQKERARVAEGLAKEQEERTRSAEALAEEQEKHARDTEAHAGRLRTWARVLGGLAAAVAVLFLVAAGVGTYAFHQRRLAETQRTVAFSRQLAAQSESARNERASLLQRSVLLAVESMELALKSGQRSAWLEADQTLRSGLALLARPVGTMERSGSGGVSSAVFSPDGTYLAAACGDETARVWRVATGKTVAQIRLHHDGDREETAVFSVAFSPDGRYLATAERKMARIWQWDADDEGQRGQGNREDSLHATGVSAAESRMARISEDTAAVVRTVATGKEVARISPGEFAVYSVAFIADSNYLATASGKTARVWTWKADTRKPVAEMSHEAEVASLVSSSGGKYLATASGKIVRVWKWEASTEKPIAEMNHGEAVTSVAISSDGKYVATASGKTARVWRWETSPEKPIAEMGDAAEVTSVALSPDGERLATASLEAARLWETARAKELARMNHENTVNSVAFSPDGRYVATTGNDGKAQLWEARRLEQEIAWVVPDGVRRPVAFSPDEKSRGWAGDGGVTQPWEATAQLPWSSGEYSVAFSPDGRRVATASRDANTVCLWDATGGGEPRPVSHEKNVRFVCFSPQGRYLATVDAACTARVWDPTSGGTIIPPIEDVGGPVCFSPDEKFLATTRKDMLQLWKWEPHSRAGVVRELIGHEDDIQAFCFHPNGKLLATASRDSTARVWDLTIRKELAKVEHEDDVLSVCFSADGKYLATASQDRTARVWRADTGAPVARMDHGEARVRAVAFSPDGKYLATGSDRARIWDVASGAEIARMDHGCEIHAVAFSGDGRYLSVVGQDGTVWLHLWRPADLIAEAASRLTRNLTYDEWQQYFPREAYRRTCQDLPIHPSFVEAGRRLAQTGDRAGALAIFRRARALQPALQLDPEAELGR
jgi:WD40 repeat protein